MRFTLSNYAKNRDDVLVLGDGLAGSTAAMLLPVMLPLSGKLGTRAEAFA
jgi:aspartate oxidase